jgi:hypothetical protein
MTSKPHMVCTCSLHDVEFWARHPDVIYYETYDATGNGQASPSITVQLWFSEAGWEKCLMVGFGRQKGDVWTSPPPEGTGVWADPLKRAIE